MLLNTEQTASPPSVTMGQMIYVMGGVLVGLAILFGWSRRAPESAQLGAVSEQWLAEYRASHPTR
jgi:hypothetical protein